MDRLLKDIVAESASFYVPQFAETEKARHSNDVPQNTGILVPYPDDAHEFGQPRKAFSLAAFIPLLSDRIYVLSPFTRSFLVSWIMVLDSVPELELVSYLPEFLDGLLYVSFVNVVFYIDFLKEIPIRPDRRCTSRDGERARRLSEGNP